MKFQKALTLPLVLLAAFAFPAASQDYLSDLSGSGIKEDVGEAFKGESLFYIDPTHGMSPGADNGSRVSTPASGTVTPWSNVEGRWTLSLIDSASRTVDLTLYQYGNEVFGRGVMATGVNSQEVTAAGFIEGSALSLRLVTVGGNSMYRLKASVSGNSIFGTYSAYSSDGISWAGNCNGNRFYATTQSASAVPTSTVSVGMGVSGGNAMS
ncbi:MAG: hypothetical protein WCY97_06580 [Methanothrix sp.]|jgi:hypothetical protein|uniref:Lipoprotein, putative n=1 Tax=Methanothrix harundinacea TaxID=301375 RepID=A0A101ILP2_9EURY|nr:MAG: Lipoprotein, putative [Methanothrix harundinacea]MDD2637673.1 hypothetical protein [Methanothrix sp.]MDI9398641.1 hypothetical protein [Euryarchaeota archaeon]KUK97516.1 MAG: Lipoprotein, putative [Methanothrix harundinacea]MCP1392195.1 hypothetical protein [Methanothrix harundinacea]